MDSLKAKNNGIKAWRILTKKRIVESFGGKCGMCGYCKSNNALELHHMNPLEKEISIGGIRANPKSWDKIVNELRKCVMLCANCHREFHDNLIIIPDSIQRFNEEYATYVSTRNKSWISDLSDDNIINVFSKSRSITNMCVFFGKQPGGFNLSIIRKRLESLNIKF